MIFDEKSTKKRSCAQGYMGVLKGFFIKRRQNMDVLMSAPNSHIFFKFVPRETMMRMNPIFHFLKPLLNNKSLFF
ncbi:MAG: hypothetical protein A2103_02715 [Gammaproteobacteria bacterium GWF2_41_13]|nr:MAG: hypothetical protein A2103_02715 [Gammaproteobacteria bacterium GWF2_41_13]